MVGEAIPLGYSSASRAAMNGQGALPGKFEHVSTDRRLSLRIAETTARADIYRDPRFAFMRRAYFEAEYFPAASSYPASIGDGPCLVMVSRLY